MPETRAYRILGSTELLLQHCQLPSLTQHQHFRALTDELRENADIAGVTPKGRQLLKLLGTRINTVLDPPPVSAEQRVRLDQQQAAGEEEQRVINESPIITLPHLTDAPPIILTRNPTAKQYLQTTPRIHHRVMRNNLPGVSRPATVIEPIMVIPAHPQRQCQKITTPTRVQPRCGPRATCSAIPSGAQQWIVTRHAINLLTLQEEASFSTMHTPRAIMKHAKMPINIEHYANPMAHPVTGCTISSYKKLMHDPATAEVRQTAFGKDFGGMAQGCDKTGQKGTNAMFLMTHDSRTMSNRME